MATSQIKQEKQQIRVGIITALSLASLYAGIIWSSSFFQKTQELSIPLSNFITFIITFGITIFFIYHWYVK